MSNPDFIHDQGQQQFRLEIGGAVAKIDYRNKNGTYYLDHSEVPYELRGNGIGKLLVETTFEYLIEHDIDAVARCTFIIKVANSDPKWSRFLN